MSDNRRSRTYPRIEVENMFASRISRREIERHPDTPMFDQDIVNIAGYLGLSSDEILAASVISRRRVGAVFGLELVEVDETVIAGQEKRHISKN